MPAGYDLGPALFVPEGAFTWTIRPAGFDALAARQAAELRQVDDGLAGVARDLGAFQASGASDAPERAIGDAHGAVASVQGDADTSELRRAEGEAHGFARALDGEARNPADTERRGAIQGGLERVFGVTRLNTPRVPLRARHD